MNGMFQNLTNVFRDPYVAFTRGHRKKIFVQQGNTHVRKRFFSVRIIQRWNSLPGEVVSAPSLGKFKSLLHISLGDALFDFV